VFICVHLWLPSLLFSGTGRIVGTLTPPGRAVRVGVIERIPATLMKLQDKEHWGRLDAAKGTYVVDDLAPGKYDLAIETKGGRTDGIVLHLEGEEAKPTYDLEVATGKLTAQRFDIQPFLEENQVVDDKERDAIVRQQLRINKLMDYIGKLSTVQRFEDKVRPLWVHGTRDEAIVLMELTRDREFYASKQGEAIWRIETWPFQWVSGVWHKPRKGLRVWQRLRLQGDAWTKLGYVFDPRLGGIEVKAGKDTTVDHALPEKLPAGMGKVPKE